MRRRYGLGKRFMPVILSAALTISNINGIMLQAFAADNMKPVVSIQSEYLKEEALEALESGMPLAEGDYSFINVDGEESGEYARLFEGDVYEIFPRYTVAQSEPGAKLKVFVTDEKVIFLFENHSRDDIKFWAKVDNQYVNSSVVVKPYVASEFGQDKEKEAEAIDLPIENGVPGNGETKPGGETGLPDGGGV